MKNSTFLLVLNHETDDLFIEELANALVPLQAHLSCFLMSPGVELPAMVSGWPPYGGVEISEDWKALLDEALDMQKNRIADIEKVLARTGVSGDVQAVLYRSAETSDYIARRARLCDLSVFAPNLNNTPQFMNEAARGVLYKSSSGLLLNGMPSSDFGRVVIAWDSSYAAAAAVRAALPYLKAADEVTIACFDLRASEETGGADPGTDVAAWLSHHGCEVVLSQYPSGGREIGQCIQDRARELGADLVVMGAYGHSRLLQTVFGGTTKTMFEQTELPVLMAH